MKNNRFGPILESYRNMPIKRKLLLVFYIQIILPLMLIGFLSYVKSSEAIKDKSIKYSQDLLKMVELRYRDLADNLDALSLELLYDNRIYEVLKSSSGMDSLELYKNTNVVRNTLREMTLSRSEIQSISIVDKDRRTYTFDSNAVKGVTDHVVPDESILKMTRQGKGKPVWIVDRKNPSDNIFVTRIVYDRDTFSEIGLISILIKRSFVESAYTDLSNDTGSNITILTENNDVVVGENGNSQELIRGLSGQSDKASGYFIDQNNKMLVSYVSLDNPKWKIVYHIYLKDLYKEINSLKYWSLLIILCALLVLSLVSISTSRDFVKPINKLIQGIKEFEISKKHDEIVLNRNDELGYLANAFNNMSKRIDNLVNRIYKEEITRKEAEIKALQAQINPHFLFNTLESINWMAQLNGVPEISDTVTALGKIMSASIGRDSRLITLGMELDYIDSYVSILKNRYEDRLVVGKKIDESLLDIKVPRLLIQPLVENAVYHGIDKITGTGEIQINIFEDHGKACIEIADNGIGMDSEQLDKLNEMLAGDNEDDIEDMEADNRNSIGLMNVNRRIKLFYGNEYGVRMESVPGKCTRAVICLPLGTSNASEVHNV